MTFYTFDQTIYIYRWLIAQKRKQPVSSLLLRLQKIVHFALRIYFLWCVRVFSTLPLSIRNKKKYKDRCHILHRPSVWLDFRWWPYQPTVRLILALKIMRWLTLMFKQCQIKHYFTTWGCSLWDQHLKKVFYN